MNNSKDQDKGVLFLKIVQSGDIIKIPLIEKNLTNEFKDLFFPLLKEFKLKQEDVYISNEEGMMLSVFDLNSSLQDVIKKFGAKLKLYSEKIF